MIRRTLATLMFCAVGAACGGDNGSPPEARRSGFGLPQAPWDSLAPEEIYGATPVENLRVTPVELDVVGIPDGWDGMRVAVVSDLQLGLWSGNDAVAEAAIAAAVATDADVIALLGDYLAQGSDPSRLTRILAPLRGRVTFAVLGDRDIRTDSLAARTSRVLAAAGVRVLRNEAVAVELGGDTAFIAGLGPELISATIVEQRRAIGEIAGGRPMGLLLAHNPVVAAQAAVGQRFPAALAGNTFCGTVSVPATQTLDWLNTEALAAAAVEGADRLFRLGDMVLFVTCGTGFGFVPIRYGAPPEVALVTLRDVMATGSSVADSMVADTLIERYERSMADSLP